MNLKHPVYMSYHIVDHQTSSHAQNINWTSIYYHGAQVLGIWPDISVLGNLGKLATLAICHKKIQVFYPFLDTKIVKNSHLWLSPFFLLFVLHLSTFCQAQVKPASQSPAWGWDTLISLIRNHPPTPILVILRSYSASANFVSIDEHS